jgi:uncharacterized protein YbjQ (UPF0145 family)
LGTNIRNNPRGPIIFLVYLHFLNHSILMDYSNITTSFDIAGRKVARNFGVVRGIIVRSRSIVGSFAAGLQTIFGGNITIYTQLCEKARQDAYELMITHAEQLGADGIIGVRYDATDIMAGVSEVLCYGTAVKLE